MRERVGALEDFEDSEVQDRLERARQQASGRTGLMSQLFNQAQDVVTICATTAIVGIEVALRCKKSDNCS